MKKIISWSLVTAMIIGLLVWGGSIFFSFSYSEWSFFIGLALSVILFFFNSSGGVLSKVTTYEASESVWKIQKDTELKSNVGAVFYGSVLYTIISFIFMLFLYF